MQSRIGVTVLVAPGPEVTITTPTFPLARAYPAAINPAPCSLAGTIRGMGLVFLELLFLSLYRNTAS